MNITVRQFSKTGNKKTITVSKTLEIKEQNTQKMQTQKPAAKYISTSKPDG